jgi:alpha-1,2-mannosyltransferase
MPRLARIARPVLHVGALAAAVAALLTFVIPALTGRFSGEFEDFSIERTAGAALLHGTDPYATFIPMAATTPVHGLGFDYPPVTAWLFQPFAALPASVADGIWLCFGLACVVGGAVIVARTVLPARWPRVSLAVVTSLLFAPATYNLWHGNINFVMFLTLALALRAWVRGREFSCAGWLAVGAAIKLAPLVLVILMVRRGWYRGAALTVAGFVGSLGLGAVLAGPAALWSFVTGVLPVLTRQDGWLGNQSLNGVLNRAVGHAVLTVQPDLMALRVISLLLSLATVAAAVWVVRRGVRPRAERAGEFSVGVLAMLLVGTISWYEHYISLLIPLAAAVALVAGRGLVRERRLAMTAALATVIFGVVGPLVIAQLSVPRILAAQAAPGWWPWVQLFSLPALSAAALMAALVVSLREPRGVGSGATETRPVVAAAA